MSSHVVTFELEFGNPFPQMNINNLTIITVTRNNPEDLVRTLTSIALPTKNWIVIDGSDEPLRAVSKNLCAQHNCQYFWFYPNGIYNAMNLGLQHVDPNNYVIFMNAGDEFHPDFSVEEISENSEWLVGRTEFATESTSFIVDPFVTPDAIRRGRDRICHQSVIIKASLLKQMGGFDETYKVAADYRMWLFLVDNICAQKVSALISRVQLGGVSDMNCTLMAKEKRNIRRESGLPSIRGYAIESARCFAKRLVGNLSQNIKFLEKAREKYILITHSRTDRRHQSWRA